MAVVLPIYCVATKPYTCTLGNDDLFREAMKKLVNVGRAFDSITNIGREGTFEIVRRG